MRSGKLREQITVQQSVETIDEMGTPTSAWSDLGALRAELVQQSTEEFLRNSGASDETVAVFRTRYMAGVTNAHRVLWRGQALNVKQVVEIGGRELEIRCVTVAGAVS